MDGINYIQEDILYLTAIGKKKILVGNNLLIGNQRIVAEFIELKKNRMTTCNFYF